MVGWRITLWAALVAVALLFLWAVRSILAPFILAFLISGLLEPTIRKMRMRGYSRAAAVWVVFVAFFGLLTAAGLWLSPMIVNQLGSFRDNISRYSTQLATESHQQNFFLRWTPPALLEAKPESKSSLDRLFDQYSSQFRYLGVSNKKEFIDKYIKPHEKQLTSAAQGFFNSLVGSIGALASQILLLIFTPIFVLLILFDMDRFKKRSASWIPPAIRTGVLDLLGDVFEVFIKYLRGVSIVVMWYALFAGVFLWLLGAPYPAVLAILFSLVYLVPLVGPVINALLIFAFTAISGTTSNMVFGFETPWVFGAVIALIYFAVMLLFDQVVFPKVVGSAVGLHPVASFFCIFAGGALFGAIGMLLAFPLAGAVKVILERLLRVTGSKEGTLSLPAVPLRHRVSQG
ncbi:MAG: AI-2E family transporter [Fimbriimonadaceae bacterium]